MKLCEELPSGVTVGRRFYRMDFDFRNVLRMMDELARVDLLPGAMAYRAIGCLMKRPPRNAGKVLDAVCALLFEGGKKSAEKVTDFDYDAGLIRAAFWQAYGVDLYHDRLHWLAFIELLNGIPESTRYAWVTEIRARPVPVPTKYNEEERRWLMKAKASVSLPMSEEEQQESFQKNLAIVASGIMAWAGGKNG